MSAIAFLIQFVVFAVPSVAVVGGGVLQLGRLAQSRYFFPSVS